MSPVLAFVLVVVLIVANGLFVAAEFGLVAVRRGSIEERAESGDRAARTVLDLLKSLTFVLSSAQFGITATSLLVGFLAEDAIGELLVSPVVDWLGLPAASSRPVTLTAAFLLSTVAQMVLGELAPKNVAIARPETVSLAVGRPMRVFSVIFGPIIRVFDTSAAWVSQRVLRTDVHEELLGGHSLDELSRIIAASGEQGSLREEQAELLLRAVELGDTRLSEVMIPRPDVAWLDKDATLDELRDEARRTGHSRFAVRGRDEDDVVGSVHIKDLLGVPPERRATVTVGAVVSPALVLPESDRLRRALGQMRHDHRTFAVVVDEYGGTAGIVTLEDLLEELVGDISDEFDRDVQLVRRLGGDRYVVQGTLRADRADDVLGLELPEGEYETIAGFVIDRLGHIPQVGERVEHEGWELVVSELDGMRVARLQVRALPGARTSEGDGR